MSNEWGGLRLSGLLLEGRTVIITGAGSVNGIGRATAKLFAAHGARVAALDIDAKGAKETAALIGTDHLGLACDVTQRDSCAAAVDTVLKTFGKIDVLINNAAIARGTRIADVTAEEYEMVQAINVRGTFVMSQLVLAPMRAAGSGNIVCLSSVAGQRGGGLYGSAHYAASKGGVIGLGKAMARELAPDGIRVNIVSPSLIKTDGSPDDSPERRAAFEKDIPLRRSGTIWEVAGAILFAASDLSGYITGATIDVNGGFYMR
jgi:NAD(P)-dependent dehydrogenase (short-subunit alcohol dehydrogenase family)